jgi:hypothetical protein
MSWRRKIAESAVELDSRVLLHRSSDRATLRVVAPSDSEDFPRRCGLISLAEYARACAPSEFLEMKVPRLKPVAVRHDYPAVSEDVFTHLGHRNLCSGGAITETSEARHAPQFFQLLPDSSVHAKSEPREFVYSEVGYRSFFWNPRVSRRSGLALISGVTLGILQPLLYAVGLGRALLYRKSHGDAGRRNSLRHC